MKSQTQHINHLIQEAFSRIACPLEGNSTYQTLEKAILQAYELGTKAAVPIVVSRVSRRKAALS